MIDTLAPGGAVVSGLWGQEPDTHTGGTGRGKVRPHSLLLTSQLSNTCQRRWFQQDVPGLMVGHSLLSVRMGGCHRVNVERERGTERGSERGTERGSERGTERGRERDTQQHFRLTFLFSLGKPAGGVKLQTHSSSLTSCCTS